MITKQLAFTHPKLTAISRMIKKQIYSYTEYQNNFSVIRNQNLTFDSTNYAVNLFPFYPSINQKKGKNIF